MSEGNSTVEYRPVKGFPGYRVGDDGSVWSERASISLGIGAGSRSTVTGEWKRLKGKRQNKFGHRGVCLHRNGKRYYPTIHRLVLEAFVGPRPPGMEARHFPDRNPANNTILNLSWASHKKNQADMRVHGTSQIGERNPSAKLTEDDVRAIRFEYAQGETTCRAIARKYHCHVVTIQDAIAGRTWKHI